MLTRQERGGAAGPIPRASSWQVGTVLVVATALVSSPVQIRSACECNPEACVEWIETGSTNVGFEELYCGVVPQGCPQDKTTTRDGPRQLAVWEDAGAFCGGCQNPTKAVAGVEGKVSCTWQRCVKLNGNTEDTTESLKISFSPKFKWEVSGFQSTCCEIDYDLDCDGQDDEVCCPPPVQGPCNLGEECNSGSAVISTFIRSSIQTCDGTWKFYPGGWYTVTTAVNWNNACTTVVATDSASTPALTVTDDADCDCDYTLSSDCDFEPQTPVEKSRHVLERIEIKTQVNLVPGVNGRWLKWRDYSSVTVTLTEDDTDCTVQ